MTLASARQLLECGHSQFVPALYVAEIGSATTCLTCNEPTLVVGVVWVTARSDVRTSDAQPSGAR